MQIISHSATAGQKICSKCNLQKNLSDFSQSNYYRDGYRGQCKNCRSLMGRSYKTRALANAPDGHKKCSACGTVKPISSFSKHGTGRDRRRGQCRECRSSYNKLHHNRYKTRRPKPRYLTKRNQRLRKQYGITHADYVGLLASQGGGCALCGFKPTDKPLCVDHCHDSGRIRGILCRACNRALALFGDNETGIRRILAYVVGPKL